VSDFIPVNEPLISQEAKDNVNEALNTGWISSAGKFVEEFEKGFAAYLGVKEGISVSNGTAALHVALRVAGVTTGDEVIVPAFTMAATWLAVIYCGAKPVFVDCTPDTYNLNPDLIEEKITSKTKVIVPVHIYGHPVDMDSILEIAKKHDLIVIEDAAEAHGAEYKGKKCGSLGDLACFSFYGNKILTTGEGGMVVTNNVEMAYKARKLKDLYHSDKKRFIHEQVGYNYRLTNLQAAVGCGELKHIEEYVAKKQWMAKKYNELLKDVPGLILPTVKDYAKCVYWMFAVQLSIFNLQFTKEQFRARLKEQGVDTRDFFYAPTDQPVLKPYFKTGERFPVTELIASRGLYLPSGLAITEEQIKSVAEAVKGIYNCSSK